MAASCVSCSSAIWPTISSRMSSSVIRPCTSPYSSTTSAICALRFRNWLSWSLTLRRVGHEPRLGGKAHDVELAHVPAGAAERRRADPWCAGRRRCSRARPSRSARACTGCCSTSSTIFCGGSSASMRLHLGAMDHDVGDLQIAQVEHAAQHVGIVARDRALLVCSSMVPRISSCAARMLASSSSLRRRQLQELAHDELDRHRQRAEHDDDDAHDRRHQQRDAVGIGERVGLRQHRGEDDDQQGHDAGGVDDADVADEHARRARMPAPRPARRPACCREHGADHLLRRAAAAVLTSVALALPSCSSACMRAREAAVSAVSLPLKNADSAIRTTIATTMSSDVERSWGLGQASADGCWCSYARPRPARHR